MNQLEIININKKKIDLIDISEARKAVTRAERKKNDKELNASAYLASALGVMSVTWMAIAWLLFGY